MHMASKGYADRRLLPVRTRADSVCDDWRRSEIADMLVPSTGDVVRHADFTGDVMYRAVKERIFDFPSGVNVDGIVSVTLVLEKIGRN